PFQYFTDHQDPALAGAVRQGRREEFVAFGWKPEDVPDPQDEATFRRSQLDWEEATQQRCARLLGWHRDLLALRRRYPELTDGALDEVRTRFDEAEQWLTFARGRVQVACNFSDRPRRVPLLRSGAAGGDARAAACLLSSH